MLNSYTKNIIVLLFIIISNVTIVRGMEPIKIAFSIEDFNIVRTVDTMEISTDNPNFFYSGEDGMPEIPYTLISYEEQGQGTLSLIASGYLWGNDIIDFHEEIIYENVYLYAMSSLSSENRKITSQQILNPIRNVEFETIGEEKYRVNFTISPFRYDYVTKTLTIIKEMHLCLALSHPGTSIENISSSDRDVKIENNYDLSGRPVETPTSGLTIKVTENPDGSRETKKIIVK